ncbi:MAG: OmpA family protein [Bacteroidales bacterium]|nr:OmpA family protein [Bacteroidales bacterium]
MKKIFLVLIFSVLFGCFGFAQSKAEKRFEQAVQLLRTNNVTEAQDELLSLRNKYPDFLPTYLALSEIYIAQNNIEQAKAELLAVYFKDKNFDCKLYLDLANIYLYQEKYDSVYLFTSSIPCKRYQEKIDKLKELADFRSFQKENPLPFSPKNMGSAINTEYDEYLPCLTADISSLLFTRRDKSEDFFISNNENGEWSKAEKLPSLLNSTFNEGAGSLSPDGRFIYFARCGAEDGLGSCDIYVSEKIGDEWQEPKNLGANVNSSFWDSQPCIASDGRTLFFVSNRKGGVGKSDIYFSYLKDNGEWTKAKNCGTTINTVGDEISPFVHQSNTVLYFASDEHLGMGGFDLFYSKIENGKFQEAINLGYPLNTAKDESSLTLSAQGDFAIYSSDLDLYSFTMPEQIRPIAASYIKGVILDKETSAPLSARLQIKNLKTGRLAHESFSDKKTGDFLICLAQGEEYAFSIACDNYLFYSENFSTETQNQEKQIFLTPIKAGESIVLKNIFFETNSHSLLASSTAELNTLTELMQNNPKLKVLIEGHTDNVGNAEHNQILSQQRAEAIVSYLTEKGIEPSRLQAKGYGFSRPIATNDTEEGRALNRRTEIKIIE